LIDAPNDRHLWARNFERRRSDVLSLQSEIARTIADQIEVKVTPSEDARLRNTKTIDPEAHAAALRGRYHWHQFFTPDGMQEAIFHFRKAIEIDPGYAPAWSGLSGCFSAMGVQSMMPPVEAAPEAKNAAKRALAVDPLLPQAHVAMAAVHLFFEWDWPATELAIKSALDLSPSCSEAYGLFAHYAVARGWGGQAVSSQRRGLDLDPMSAVMNTDLTWLFLLNREYEKALETSLATRNMKFAFPLENLYLSQIYLCTGKYEEAIAEIDKVVPSSGEAPVPMLAIAAYAHARAGKTETARKMLRRVDEISKRYYVSSYDRAVLHTGLGEKDKAVRALAQAMDDGEPRVIWLNVEPIFDSLRGHRRFQELVLRLKLE
jgi:tetratricopeptide (TPR) repeat protein